MKEPRNYPTVKSLKTTDSGHVRIETRTYYLSSEIVWYEDKADRRNLRTFGMVCSKVEKRGIVTKDVCHFITLLEDISLFSRAV